MILDRIVARVKQRVAAQQRRMPCEWLQERLPDAPTPDCFFRALARPGIQVIAEIKKASPSAGIISAEFDPPAIASEYASAGAAAISVLTEEDFFQGSLNILARVRAQVALPLLRKDFLIDPYQLYQARYYGANCVLLIAGILSERQLAEFQELAGQLNLDALVEVHNDEELQKVLNVGAAIIGINNRDLTTFRVDLGTTLRLRDRIPPQSIVVSESGINTREHVRALEQAGVDAILVGERLMRSVNKQDALKQLVADAF